jgi:Ca2+-binding EF-hand superfamily protein
MAGVVVAKGRRAKKIALHDASVMYNVARMEKNEQLDQLFSRHDEGDSGYLNFEQLRSASAVLYICTSESTD